MIKKADISFFLLFLVMGAISLGQLTRIQLGPVVGTAQDLILLLSCIILTISQPTVIGSVSSQGYHKIISSRPVFLLILLVSIGWVRANFAHQLSLMAVLMTLRLGFYALGIYLLTHQRPPMDNRTLKGGLFFTTFLMSCWGILQYLFLPDVRFLHTFGFDDHYYRLIGPLLDPNFAGLLAIMSWLFWQSIQKDVFEWLHIQHISRRCVSLFSVSIQVILLASLAMTFSRSSWLAFTAVNLYQLFSQQRFRVHFFSTMASLLFLAVVIGVLPKPTGEGVRINRTSTITARANLTQGIIQQWQPLDWVIGRGLFNVRRPATPQNSNANQVTNTAWQPDNIIVQIVGSLGLIGTGILIWLVFTHYKTLQQAAPTTQSLLLALLVHAQFNNSFFQPQIWVLLLLGIIADQTPRLKFKLHR